MEQNLPRCVREAWDSVDEERAPVLPLPWFLQDEGMSWSLPLYPKLGHPTWDDREFDWELLSHPCELLLPDCPRHGPRALRTPRWEAELPDPNPTPETEESEMRPAVEAAAQAPDSPPGVEAAAQTPADPCPEDSLRLSPGSWDRHLEPDNSEEPTLPPDLLELLAADLPNSGRQDQGLPPLPLVPKGP